jgi:hypothetical protein
MYKLYHIKIEVCNIFFREGQFLSRELYIIVQL